MFTTPIESLWPSIMVGSFMYVYSYSFVVVVVVVDERDGLDQKINIYWAFLEKSGNSLEPKHPFDHQK